VLKRQRVRYSESDLNAALLHLRDKDILTGDNRFVVSLMQLWLRRNRPLERVRQELVEVNPIANRYVEIGEEYRALGDQVKALDCFQQALVVDPQNLKAQVSLAAIYQGEGDHSQAIQAYEAALAIDVEDIAARAGFCETNLALGDQARAAQEIEGAAQSYRRVLSINADHTEALQRLADIYALKAEQALDQGRDDDALIALKEALQFTPEDPALEARLAEVQAQKLTKIVRGVLQKSQQQAAARQWERAVATLEGVLEITPGQAEIEKALSEVRAAQRKYLLESLADSARSLASAERWEEALAAWQEYLDLEPEDAEAARTALGQVETQRELDQFYIQALEALEKKDYPQAVGLLKRVVFQDEAYKNAARLLAQAIEAQRARRSIWRLWSRLYAGSESTRLEAQRARHPVWRKWMWAGLALLALVVLVWASFLLLPGWFQAASNSPAKTTMLLEESPTSQAEQAVKQTLVEIVRTSTPMVTPTNTPPATPTYTPPPTYTPTLTYTRIPTRTPILTPVAGATQVSPVDGMVMIYVPAGEFLMGKGENEAADDDEKPQHRVYLDSYWIDRTEVTNAMYALCVHAGVCQSPISTSSDTRESYFGNPQFDAYPVIFVSWDDAKAYCTWAGRRLPTEAEWEKAARWDPLAGSARRFPWGDEIRYCEHANCTTCVGDTNEVGSYSAGASAYGALDMAGNVWEWVADWYDGDYYSAYSLDGWPANPMGPSVGWYRVLRGGSWYSYSGWDLRAGNRVQGNGTNSKTGFRCAYTP